jgi:hypothetical protein
VLEKENVTKLWFTLEIKTNSNKVYFTLLGGSED